MERLHIYQLDKYKCSCTCNYACRIVRGLFEHARQSGEYSVLFIDEIDSICRARNNREDEHVRRVKTEFLQQMEGVSDHYCISNFQIISSQLL